MWLGHVAKEARIADSRITKIAGLGVQVAQAYATLCTDL
jgi:hypothetical protein